MENPTNAGDLRVIKTRRTIRTALVSLLSETELSDITITALCARAQVNRKTFYRHYRSISDVINEVEDEILGDFAEILRMSKTSVFDIGAVLSEISALISGNREYFANLLALNPELFSGGRVKAMLKRAVEVALRDTGSVKDEGTVRMMSEYTVSGVLSLYSAWFDEGCEGSINVVTETARKLVISGFNGFIPDERLKEMF